MVILSWMGYSAVVGTAAALAAGLAERLLRAQGRSARGVWVGALVVTLILSAVAWWSPVGNATVELILGPASMAGLTAPAAEPVPGAWHWPSLLHALDSAAPLSWLLSSALLLGLLTLSAVRLHRRLARWRRTELRGVPVHVSHATGPLVVGVRRPAIVVPAWILGEPDEAQDLILEHEREHLRARDPQLMLGAFLAAALVPWNPAVWWQFRRLRDAVELDCDRRVLAAGTPALRRRYGALLARVAHHLRAGTPRPALAAFAERGTVLERRIRTMLHLLSPLTYKQRAALGLGSLGLLALACTVPGPDRSSPTDVEVPVASSAVVEDQVAREPIFTPYTKGPEIVNRAEVQARLVSEYPPLLRNAGIGGTVRVWFYIDETGRVQDTRIHESSGHTELDDAALRVAGAMEFTAGMNRDRPTAVWVMFPITFRVR